VTSNVQSAGKATLAQVLSRIAALARLAPDVEQGRRLPAELVSALKSARIYGMLVPPRYGGLELDAHSGVRVAEGCFELAGSRAVYESSLGCDPHFSCEGQREPNK
jgi:indole-3-acetate monooxygenase